MSWLSKGLSHSHKMLLPLALLCAGTLCSANEAESSHTELSHLVESWGLAELAAVLPEPMVTRLSGEALLATDDPAARAAALLVGIGAPVAEGIDAMQTWAENDPVFQATALMPEFPAEAAASQCAQRFQGWLQDALGDNLITGYNLLQDASWPELDSPWTIVYGHSDIRHARQLLLLMRLYGLQPEFQFVAKLSAFRFREEWGTPPEYLTELPDGGHKVVAAEYDLFLFFASEEASAQFARLVTQYAKRDTAEETGLIHGAWWQPFYRCFTAFEPMIPARQHLLYYNGFRSNVMSPVDSAKTQAARLAERFPDFRVEPQAVWVNPGFFRFLEGSYR